MIRNVKNSVNLIFYSKSNLTDIFIFRWSPFAVTLMKKFYFPPLYPKNRKRFITQKCVRARRFVLARHSSLACWLGYIFQWFCTFYSFYKYKYTKAPCISQKSAGQNCFFNQRSLETVWISVTILHLVPLTQYFTNASL